MCYLLVSSLLTFLCYSSAAATKGDNVIIPRGVDSIIRHVHLAFGDAANSIRVGFATNSSEWPANFSSVCLFWRLGDTEHVSVAQSEFVRTYNASQWRKGQLLPWDLRFVTIQDLADDSQYNIQCGVRDDSGMHHLTSEPVLFDARKPGSKWSFVAFGDLGVEGSDAAEGKVAVGFTRKRIEDEVLNRSARFVLHYGDLSYARGVDVLWDNFLDSIEPVASRVPWMISPGNHEVQVADSGGESGVPMFARFWMPQQCGGNPYWYSFDYGGVHFISLSTEHEFGNGSAQMQFLQDDLQRHQGQHAFTVVVGHRPSLSSHQSFGKDHSSLDLERWNAWQPLFVKHQVDLILWGHIHAYERTMEGGIPQITSGMAGQSYCCGAWDYNPPSWSIFREDSHGLLRVAVDLDNKSSPTMHVEYVRGDDGKVYDSLVVHGRGKENQHHSSALSTSSPTQSSPSKLLSQRFEGCMEEGSTVAGPMPAPLVPPGLCPAKQLDTGIFV